MKECDSAQECKSIGMEEWKRSRRGHQGAGRGGRSIEQWTQRVARMLRVTERSYSGHSGREAIPGLGAADGLNLRAAGALQVGAQVDR